MGELFAVVIGIEKYRDPFLKPVLFAEKDARAVSEALVQLGCPVKNQCILINEAATATTIDSDVRAHLAGRSAEDQCFIFFAGHGFSDGSHNYLAAHDTKTRDIERTSIRLQRLLGFVKECPAKKKVIFLDACHTGITVEDTLRSALTGIDTITDEEFCAGFASCRSDEKSISSKNLQHGIWTYYLLEALSGRAKDALDGERLTAMKLQKYLYEEVPRRVRAELSQPRPQTPRFFGSLEGVATIADLSALLAKRRAESAANALSLKRVAFVLTSEERISSLRGFDKKKGHFVPDKASNAAKQFIFKLVDSELQEHIDDKYNQLRTKMKIPIRDIEATAQNGAATIRTASFDYNVTIEQDLEDPAMAIWRYELINVSDAAILDNEDFNKIFGNTFDRIEFTFGGRSPDILEIASSLEESGHDVECPRDQSYCKFTPEGSPAAIEITPGAINFVFARRQPPRALVAAFQTAFALLSGHSTLTPLLSSSSSV